MNRLYQKIIIVVVLFILLAVPLVPALAQVPGLSSVPVFHQKDVIEETTGKIFDEALNKLLQNPDLFCEDQSYKGITRPEERILAIGLDVEACKQLLKAIAKLPNPQVADALHQDNIDQIFKERKLKLANQTGTILSNLQLELFKEKFNFSFTAACQTLDQYKAIGDKLSQSYSALSLIGDNGSLVAQLKAQDEWVENQRLCRENFLKVLDETFPLPPASELFTVNNEQAQTYKTEKLRMSAQLQSEIEGLKQTHIQLAEQTRVASRGLWKAVFIQLLLKNTQRISSNLVQSLTEKFKINDYLGYADALASTVYTNRLIASTVDGNTNQMVIRSLITNPLVAGKFHPQAQAAANAYVAANTQSLAYADANYYEKLAALPNCQAFAWCMTDQWNQKAAQIRTQAKDMSLQEIAQGQGYKSPLNSCATNLTQQQTIDKQYQAVQVEYNDRKSQYDTFVTGAQSNGDNVSSDDLNKAQADYEAAQKKLSDFPYQFNKVALNICEGINSPASKLNFTINDLIGTQISHLKDYNDNNLPEMVKLVSGITDVLVQKYLFGKNVSTSNILQEGMSLTTGVLASGQDGNKTSIFAGTAFYFKQQDANTYSLFWDYSVLRDRNKASYVQIAGPGISNESAIYHWSLSVAPDDGPEVTISKDEEYTASIYDGSGKLITTDKVFITNVASPASAYSNRSGHVAGASIVLPRGPSTGSISLRGPE